MKRIVFVLMSCISLLSSITTVMPVGFYNNGMNVAQKAEVITSLAMIPASIVEVGADIERSAPQASRNAIIDRNVKGIRAFSGFVCLTHSLLAAYNHNGRARGYNLLRSAIHGYDFVKNTYDLMTKPVSDEKINNSTPNNDKKTYLQRLQDSNNELKHSSRVLLSLAESFAAYGLATGMFDKRIPSGLGNNVQRGDHLISSLLLTSLATKKALATKDTKAKLWTGAAGLSAMFSLGEAWGHLKPPPPEYRRDPIRQAFEGARVRPQRARQVHRAQPIFHVPVQPRVEHRQGPQVPPNRQSPPPEGECLVCLNNFSESHPEDNIELGHTRVPQCGHPIHRECFRELLNRGIGVAGDGGIAGRNVQTDRFIDLQRRIPATCPECRGPLD